MTKSHFDADVPLSEIGKWPWSIVPTRAFGDKRLIDADRRVLGALCAFVNRAGVCWPSATTLSDLSGFATRKSVIDSLTRLKRLGYVRQLKPKDYQVTASGWKTNRYQVLWLGDEPLPSLEDIQAARALQDDLGRTEGQEGKGVVGDSDGSLPLAHALASAYSAAVERATGQARRPDNEMGAALRLAARGVTVGEVLDATRAVALAALARRAGVPALADVERAL
jgi:hypothetical protein